MKFYFQLLVSLIVVYGCQSQDKSSCVFNYNASVTDECGYVEVPRNRASNSNATTQLAYIVIKSKSEQPKKDPVVFLQGGPGGDVLRQANIFSQLVLDPNRDYIIYDQRGIGYSEELCPELTKKLLEIMAQDLKIKSEIETLLRVIEPCKAYIASDDRQFSTTTNAEDLEALRKHLGYKQLNLFGGSYGTRLGLKYMELYPNRVRSAILSGLFPPEIRMYDSLFSSFETALNKVFMTCKNSSECQSKYPNLKSEFLEIYEDLASNPIVLPGEPSSFVLNQQDALLFMHQMLYTPNTIRNIPNYIKSLKERDTEKLGQFIREFLPRLSTINLAVYYSIMTSDESNFNNKLLLQEDSKHLTFAQDGLSFFSADPMVIEVWPTKVIKSNTMNAVKSDVPTLLISGDFDPVTPNRYGDSASKSLTHSQHLIFNNYGHVPINYCFFSLAKSFLDDPMAPITNDCYKNNPPIRWN